MADETEDEDINEEMSELSDIGEEEGEKNIAIKECFKDLEFPISKKALVAYARKNCSKELADRIEKASVDEFNNVAEVEEIVL